MGDECIMTGAVAVIMYRYFIHSILSFGNIGQISYLILLSI